MSCELIQYGFDVTSQLVSSHVSSSAPGMEKTQIQILKEIRAWKINTKEELQLISDDIQDLANRVTALEGRPPCTRNNKA